ncbi:MAG TPA: hypothetical protein QGF02_03905 [Candidatus Babeliales bacterium]|nr:hypothetical protein [Candidatus Babeliales bacterium]
MEKNNVYMLRSIAQTISTCLGFELARQIKCSVIIGAQTMFFSAGSMVAPVFGSNPTSLWSFGLFIALKATFMSYFMMQPINFILLYHIPLFFAAALFAPRSKWLVTSFFAVAMAAFMIGSVGNVWLYAMLWIVPMAANIFFDGLFVRALRSTFAAHAIGSLIYLYTIPMTADLWVAIIPVALVERLLFAVGTMAVYYAVQWVSKRIGNLSLVGSRQS